MEPRLCATDALNGRYSHVYDGLQGRRSCTGHGAHRRQTCIHRTMHDFLRKSATDVTQYLLHAVKVRHHHSARSTAALTAPKLRPTQSHCTSEEHQTRTFQAEIAQKRHLRLNMMIDNLKYYIKLQFGATFLPFTKKIKWLLALTTSILNFNYKLITDSSSRHG